MKDAKRIEVRANDIDFVAYELGEGPLLLCLHGFPDHARSLRHQMEPFAKAGYRVVAPYMRGYAPTGFAPDLNPTGLAYDAERDVFFVMAQPVGGPKRWYRTITGPDHPDSGREVASCRDFISSAGLGWDPATRSLWTVATGSIRQVDPTTCTEISTLTPQATTNADLFRVSDVDQDGKPDISAPGHRIW